MYNTRSLLSTFVACCGLALFTVPAHCSDLVLEPCADATIMNLSDFANDNFGSDPILLAQNNGSERMNILLKFQIGTVKSRSIRSAHLRLWAGGWTGDFINNSVTTIYAMSAPWEEKEVTWNTASAGKYWKQPGGDITKGTLENSAFALNTLGIKIASGESSMMEWDVTDLVRLWAKGTLKNYGLRLDAGDGIFLFESRESPFTQMHPQLIIDFGKE